MFLKSKLIFHLFSSNWKKAVDICWVLKIPVLPRWQLPFSWGPNDYVALFVSARTGQRPHVEYDLVWSHVCHGFFTGGRYHVATLDLSITCLSHRQPLDFFMKKLDGFSFSGLACFNQPCQFVDLPSLAEKSWPWYLTFQTWKWHPNRPSKTVTSKRFLCFLCGFNPHRWMEKVMNRCWNPPSGKNDIPHLPSKPLPPAIATWHSFARSWKSLASSFLSPMPVQAGNLPRIAVRIWEEFLGWFSQTILC